MELNVHAVTDVSLSVAYTAPPCKAAFPLNEDPVTVIEALDPDMAPPMPSVLELF